MNLGSCFSSSSVRVLQKWVVGLILCTISVVLTGCFSPTTQGSWDRTESRSWDCPYTEVVSVTTEPDGCRIYVDDRYSGTSPCEVRLEEGKVRVTQQGSYVQHYHQEKDFVSGMTRWAGDAGRTQTIWKDGFTFEHQGGPTCTIKAFKDGYQTATQSIRSDGNSPGFRSAVSSSPRVVEGDRLQTNFVGRRSVLLSLLPDRPKVEAGNQQQQQQQQQTVVIPGAAQPGGQQTGTVIVSASVEGADIYVDGLFVGNAPANLKLSEGVHVIEVKKDGYETFKRELRVFAAGEVSLKAELKKP